MWVGECAVGSGRGEVAVASRRAVAERMKRLCLKTKQARIFPILSVPDQIDRSSISSTATTIHTINMQAATSNHR